MTTREQSSDTRSLSGNISGIGATLLRRRRGPCRNHLSNALRLERVIRVMSNRLDVPMTNEDMADIACLSPCHFNRVFRNVTGIPPIQFHYALRLDQAKRLLMSTDLSITEICFEVGYNSLGSFTSRFNELVGLSPNAFRRLTRRFVSTRLINLRAFLLDIAGFPKVEDSIVGAIAEMPKFDGLTFVALFQRALPGGRPAACALISGSSKYSLPRPSDGKWYVLSVAIPWAASGAELLTLDGLARGRSGPICVQGGRWSGLSTVDMALPRLLDPPILAAIPVLLDRITADRELLNSTYRISPLPEAVMPI